jgi:putative ABC transport system permease protein
VIGLLWTRGLLARRALRLLGVAAGVAVAVALVASIGTFLAGARSTMTQRSTQVVPVDWQVEASVGADPAAVLQTVAAFPRIKVARPVGFAATTGLSATAAGTTQSTGPGVVLGIPSDYAATFPGELRSLAGPLSGVLVAQQTAANLRVRPGDPVSIGRHGAPATSVTVDGVVDLPQADALFQTVGALAGAQPSAPPDNVILLPLEQFQSVFGEPDGASSVRAQIHVRLDRRLPANPSAAYSEVVRRARNLELRLAGTATVGDNLGRRLDAVRSDALYAQMLFFFLGAPGVALAAMLTAVVAEAGRSRRRREQALLRARGATRGRLVRLAVSEAVLTGTGGALLGLLALAVLGRAVFGLSFLDTPGGPAWGWATVLGLVVALVTVVVPAWRDAVSVTVSASRREIQRAPRPRWMGRGVDVILLAVSLVAYWTFSRRGSNLVVAPEGAPTISIDYTGFVGPALLWVSAALLVSRLTVTALDRGQRVVRWLLTPLAGPLAATVAATTARRRRELARLVVLVALSATFALSTAVFNSTYRQQAEVDALLTNGANVVVSEPPTASPDPELASRLASVAGVKNVEPLRHRFAYVGPDLQDLYGVRPGTIVRSGRLQDAYFAGGRAQQLISALERQRDGVLVSVETARDFQLTKGDTLTLRIRDTASGQLIDVPFRFIGIVKEFPTAPTDSFLVANGDYVSRMTGSGAISTYLLDTTAPSPAVAKRVRELLGAGPAVSDIATARRVVGSSLTAVDLGALTRIELAFALLLGACAAGLALALNWSEHRRSHAITAALGARSRQIGAFVWADTAVVVVGGCVAGAVVGYGLTKMLVGVLTHVFDPPPTSLSIPWGYLGTGALVVGLAAAAAAVSATAAVRRPPVRLLRSP